MASESAGEEKDRDKGHRNHFRQLREEGKSWSGNEPNTLFQNRGDGTFDEVGNVLGLYLRLDSRGPATADIDGDGDLDLLVYNRNNPTIKVFRNDYPGQGHILRVHLIGRASGLLPAGAQAIATCDGESQLQHLTAGSGFIAQSEPVLTFGLGACSTVQTLEVRWPSGAVETWSDLPADRLVTLTEGEGPFDSQAFRPRNFNRTELQLMTGELSAPRPDLTFDKVADSGPPLSLSELDERTVVINFWATWCTACRAEMPDLEALHASFASRGVTFLGVSLDEERPADEVQAFLDDVGVTYQQLWGTLDQQAPFASLGSSPPGAIPVTAVLHRGHIRHVEVGKIDTELFTELLDRLLGE